MTEPLRILLLEDNETDAKLIKRGLQHSGLAFIVERVDAEEAFAEALTSFEPDIVLSDHSVAQFDARAALRLVRAVRPTTPVIIVTGELSPQKTVEVVRAGAEDVILKANLERLAASISEALAIRKRLRNLTRRQLEVLKLVSEGNRTSDVARMLNLSTKTVERHREEMMRRLGIHDVVGLVQYARRVGLITAYN